MSNLLSASEVRRGDVIQYPTVRSNGMPIIQDTGISVQNLSGTWSEPNPYIWGVCYLVTLWKNGDTTRATGYVIADYAIATSAHVVYISSRGGWCDYVKVYPSRKGSDYSEFGMHESTTITCSGEYIDGNTGADYDYAVIEVESDIGSETGLFGWTTSAAVGNTVICTSYPGKVNGDTVIKQYRSTGTISSLTALRIASKNVNAVDGSSGAPLYNSGYLAQGTVHGGTDSQTDCTRITSSIASLYAEFR